MPVVTFATAPAVRLFDTTEPPSAVGGVRRSVDPMPAEPIASPVVTAPATSDGVAVGVAVRRAWSPPRPFPLANSGASCYMNALLQALASCRGFVEAAAASAGAAPTATGAVLREFAARCQSASAPATDSAARVLAAVLADRARLGYPPGAFGPGQQSASEALTFAVGLADAADAPGSAPWASRTPPIAPGPIAAAFAFRFDARRVCRRCGARGAMPAPSGVVLPAFGDAWLAGTPARPAGFAAIVAADGAPGGEPAPDFVCEGCGVAGATSVTRRLRRAPPVLVLAFNQYGEKFAPEFPPAFELPRRGGGALTYRATAQVVHQGGLGGGHYWAIARRAPVPGGPENVFVLNDGHVAPAPEMAAAYAGAPPGVIGLRPALGAYLVMFCLDPE